MSNPSNLKNKTSSSISDIAGLFNNLIVAPLTIKIPALNSLRRAGSRIPPAAKSEEDKGEEADEEETEKEEEEKEEEENDDDLEEVQIILNPSESEGNASLIVGNIASPKSHNGVRSQPRILRSDNQSIAKAALVSSTSEVVPSRRNESSSSSTSVQVKTKAPSQFLLTPVTDELENPPTELTLAQRHGAREERLPGQTVRAHTSTAGQPRSDFPRPVTARGHRGRRDSLDPTLQSEKVELANLRKKGRNRNFNRKTRYDIEEDSTSHYSQRGISSGQRSLASRIAPKFVSGSSRAAQATKGTETLVHRRHIRDFSSRYSNSPYQIGVRRTRLGRSDAFPDERILANATSSADPSSSETSGAPYSVSTSQGSNAPNDIANTIRSFPRSTPDDGNLADYEDESPVVQPSGPTFVHKPLAKSASAMSVDDVVLPAPKYGGPLVKTDSMMSVDVPITASRTRALAKSESDMSIVIEDQPTNFGGAFVQQTQSLQKCASVTMVDACDIRAYDTNEDNKIMNMDTESQNTPSTGPSNAPVFSPPPAQAAFAGHWIYQSAPVQAFAHAPASSPAYQPTAPIQHQYQSTFPVPQQQPHPSVIMENISRAFTDPPDISSAIPRPLNKMDPSPPLPPSQTEPTMFKPLPRQDTFWNEVERTTLKVSQTKYRSPPNRGGQKRSWENAGHWASMDQDASQGHRRRRIDPHTRAELNHNSHEILPTSPLQPLRGLPIRKKDRRTKLKESQDRETPIDLRHRCCGSGILRCITYVVDSCTAITKS
ncbi:uncharacterized protein C8R40DRAFT_1235044 [Lentinula edodes]|uniref:uncharacterized protein n=1 Tax=Lentinula edodes TaxID=5353 RepID=UPI001E8CADB9|nr:uncharacterized protein C8R40DRAFT_1235044 [Lentinula edodes]KAH7878475.1 hypothetical protein C8R40DRAFT_1235044 [Lentinula edodes]